MDPAAAAHAAAEGRHWTPNDLRKRKITGLSLAIGGNLLISGALNIQKLVHNRNERRPTERRMAYTKLPLWWLGFVMTLLGEFGNFAAYGFAEASLVTPLGAVSVVSNAFIAAVVLGEGLRTRDVCGCLLVVAGSAIIAATTSMHEEYLDPELFMRYVRAPLFLGYSSCLLVAIVVVYAFRDRYGPRFVYYYVLLCSLIGSVTVMSAKGLSSFFNSWAYGGTSPLLHPTAYILAAVLGVTAVLQVKYLNLAMQSFGNTETVPVFYVLFTLCTITASSVLYRDFQNESVPQIVSFGCGCIVTFCGVALITSNRDRSGNDSAGSPLVPPHNTPQIPNLFFDENDEFYEDGPFEVAEVVADIGDGSRLPAAVLIHSRTEERLKQAIELPGGISLSASIASRLAGVASSSPRPHALPHANYNKPSYNGHALVLEPLTAVVLGSDEPPIADSISVPTLVDSSMAASTGSSPPLSDARTRLVGNEQ
ncbi:magnesium transporter NIPA-domain-containing protein [Pavlovales sp. CCMP2436]|nr:magnesium transporter NIPA-domain-containing protein [Pavlovales sp. CCMP2436]